MIVAESVLIIVMFGGLTMIRIFGNEHTRFTSTYNEWSNLKRIKKLIKENAPESIYEDDKEECTICIEKLKGKVVRTLRCNHIFHKECIDKWICSNHNTCPNCNGSIIEYNDFIDYDEPITY